jgi:hypothetical protein
MREGVQANVGRVAKETVDDGAYASAERWGEAPARGYEVLVAAGVETGGPKRGEYDSTEFAFDAKSDEVICPQGQRLKFEGMKKKDGERSVRSYRCQAYPQCPVRARCSRRKDGRRIEMSPQHGALRRQRAKRHDPVQQALLRRPPWGEGGPQGGGGPTLCTLWG